MLEMQIQLKELAFLKNEKGIIRTTGKATKQTTAPYAKGAYGG